MSGAISQQTLSRLNLLYGNRDVKPYSEGTESLFIALITLQLGRANFLFHQKLASGGVQAVADNLEGVAVFVLSRMWSDLIAVFLLGFHAIPYCGNYIATDCTSEAPASSQFIYVLWVIPLAGLLKHLAEDSGLTKLPGMYDDIPMILKYIVGWAFGNACIQFAAEIKDANPGMSEGLIDVIFTSIVTIVGGFLVIFILPLTKEIEFGSGKIVNWIEDLLEDILDMVVRCFDVSIMVMWGYTVGNFVNGSLTEESFGVRNRTDFFFACTASFVGVMLIIALEQMEDKFRKIGEKAFKEVADNNITIVTHWTHHATAFSDILQRAISWVAGCAWSDVLFNNVPSLSAQPYFPTILTNLVVVLVITALSCLMLIARVKAKGAQDDAESMTDRNVVEASFISDAMSFFVLGAWLVFIRNVFAPFSHLMEQITFGVNTAFGMTISSKVGDIISVLIFAPVLTVVFFNLAERVMSRLAAEAKSAPPVSKAHHEQEAKEAANELKEERRERDVEAEKLAKRKLLVDEHSLLILLLSGKFSLAKELMSFKLENGGLKTIVDFLEGAAVFALSRMWSDLISAFIFGLHAIPYCGGFVATECVPEASSSAQFLYAVCAVPIAGLLKHLAESTGITSLPGMYDDIPMMLKYIVGWGFGNAFQQWLIEITAANPGLCIDGNCTLLNVGFAAASTLVCALVILLLRPAAQEIECGNSTVINWLEDLLEDILQMIIRGAEVVSMVLWYYAASHFSHLDASGANVLVHLDFFWACTATFLGAIAMVLLESVEQNLARIRKADNVPASEGHWTDAPILLSDVIQSCFGFVTGCAWSDWLFGTVTVLNAQPTWPVILTNLAVVCVISILSCYWLVMNASSDGIEESNQMSEEEKKAQAEAKATDRNEVEKQFFSGTLGFFVLGGWLVVMRNIFAPFMLLIEGMIGWFDDQFGLDTPQKTGDLIAVLLYAPIMTVILFTIAGRVVEILSKRAGVETPPKGKHAASEHAEQEHVRVSRVSRASSRNLVYDENYAADTRSLH